VTSGALNVANVKTKGIDSEFNYAIPAHLGESPSLNGTFNIRALFTYQPVLTTTQFAGAAQGGGCRGTGWPGLSRDGVPELHDRRLVGGWQERCVRRSGTANLIFLTCRLPPTRGR
jgi:hypothetical protein